jgi:hypothetical protein
MTSTGKFSTNGGNSSTSYPERTLYYLEVGRDHSCDPGEMASYFFSKLTAYCRTILTIAVPVSIISSSRAAARLTSMMRPRPYGPRSVMRTMTVLPLPTFVTSTLVPKGNVR